MSSIKCFFVEDTGKLTDWREIRDDAGNKLGEKQSPILRRTDTGEEFTDYASLPVGAMWFADWYGLRWNPQLGFSLIVKTPGGDWHVDQKSSNCGMPEDKFQEQHHCWIIEGEVPNITVSKNGKTCSAGGGSIQIGSYHGFLRNGYLEEC